MIKISLAVLALLIADASTSQSEAARKSKPLPIGDLHRVYSGKTWFWPDGAAYFRADGRFFAHSGTGQKRSYMEGGWGAYNNGKVCFSGTWHSSSGSGFDSTCFSHTGEGGKIQQRRNPVGDWYTFKNAKPKKGDEYKKLVHGDWATAKVKATKSAVKLARAF